MPSAQAKHYQAAVRAEIELCVWEGVEEGGERACGPDVPDTAGDEACDVVGFLVSRALRQLMAQHTHIYCMLYVQMYCIQYMQTYCRHHQATDGSISL